jgi:hypothetical protein
MVVVAQPDGESVLIAYLSILAEVDVMTLQIHR